MKSEVLGGLDKKNLSSFIKSNIHKLEMHKFPPDFLSAENHRVTNHQPFSFHSDFQKIAMSVGPEKDINDLKEGDDISYCGCCAR